MSLQAAYALLAGKRGRHLEGDQMKKDRQGFDNAKRGGSENEKWRLRLFRARRDLSRAGYKVQDIREKHYVVDNSCQADHEEGCRQTKDVENIFATPLFGTRIGNILDYGEKEDVEKWVPTFIQVGGWTHPLIPGASPVLEASNGAFMFPDVYADDTNGAAIGIVLADEVEQATRDHLRKLLDETIDIVPVIIYMLVDTKIC